MVNADDQDQTSQGSATAADTKGLNKVEETLASIQEQLKAQNDHYQQQFASLAQSKSQPAQELISDDDVFDAKRLNEKVQTTAGQIAKEIVQQERELNTMIYNLAQDYPEIQSDQAVRKALMEAHSSLSKKLQGTAEGYEMAVLKAVTKAGLVPKSKRPAPVDEDVSMGSRSSGSSRKQAPKGKVSDRAIMVAELLKGRALTQEEMKGLEEASKRDSYRSWR